MSTIIHEFGYVAIGIGIKTTIEVFIFVNDFLDHILKNGTGSRIKVLYTMLMDSIDKIRKEYVTKKYNDFTISEYFRKQGVVFGENNRIMIHPLGDNTFLGKR